MTNQAIVEAYSQSGGDLPYFVGNQYGSGWLQSLGRFAFPILKKVFRVAGKTAEDVIVHDKPVLDSLRDNTVQEVFNPQQSSINRPRKRRANQATNIPPLFQQKRNRSKKPRKS